MPAAISRQLCSNGRESDILDACRSWRLIEAVRGVPSATPVVADITGALFFPQLMCLCCCEHQRQAHTRSLLYV